MATITSTGRDSTNTALLVSTFVIAVCGLVYELLAGTISSYLLGDSVYQFSIVIGVFMAAMGLGSYLSRYVERDLADCFIFVQILVGVIGGLSALLLFFAFSHLHNYNMMLLLVTISAGALVGLEIPLIIRILRDHQTLAINVSNVLTADYLGALFASLLFPIVLVPQLGLVRTSLLFGLLNLCVAGLAIYCFRELTVRPRRLSLLAGGASLILFAGFIYADRISGFFESRLYNDEVVFAQTTPYQRVVVTRDANTVSLYLNGALQFNSLDERRYHESLVHPVMSLVPRPQRVLILGGGDGLALREVRKYHSVEHITLVDLDPVVTDLFTHNPRLRALNENAFADSRVTVVNTDAWKYLEAHPQRFDVVIIDLPDPHNISLSRLYSVTFYQLVAKHLNAHGALVTQATSPMFAREAFWCIANTLGEVDAPYRLGRKLNTLPYHVYVPSFGDWGFVIATAMETSWDKASMKVAGEFLDGQVLASMPHFPRDMSRLDTGVNTLQTHRLTRYYEEGWAQWFD